MKQGHRWPPEAWVPLLSGVYWLWRAPEHGVVGFLFSIVPGCLLLGSGVSMLMMPGDRRIAEFSALGGALGVIFALPALFVMGPLAGILLIAVSAASFLAAGFHSISVDLRVPRVPPVPSTIWAAAQVACDEALLATMQMRMPLPGSGGNQRVGAEVEEALALYGEKGWLDKPASYHSLPPPLEDPHIRTRRVRNRHFEHLSFESGYSPEPGEPGSERWQSYAPNRIAHAWVVRHAGPPRPWLVCIHGYQMGDPRIDLLAFPPEYFHDRLGLNLLLPVLPLHGLRKIGKASGDGFIAGDILDTIHAEAQAMWDIRRLLSWLRTEGEAPAVGALGLSLGGYNASLLASLDDDLACVIAGIPLADFTRAIFRHGPMLHIEEAMRSGVEEEPVRRITSVVSPLDLEPLVPHERRYIFGATGDRLVPPDQVRDLYEHWDRPAMVWYHGGHLTFRAHADVRRLVRRGLGESGLAA